MLHHQPAQTCPTCRMTSHPGARVLNMSSLRQDLSHVAHPDSLSGGQTGCRRKAVLSLSWWVAIILTGAVGCSEDMDRQPSVQPMAAPRLHSASGSVPRQSRANAAQPPHSDALAARGRTLYAVNCAHCHGATGAGDGLVATFLTHPPANLRAPAVSMKSPVVLYTIVTEGLAVMPPFRGELSAEERWAIVAHLKNWGPLQSERPPLPDPGQPSPPQPPSSTKPSDLR